LNREEIPDTAIEAVARHINSRNNRDHRIPVVGTPDNMKTPQYFEILPFDKIDDSERSFFAVDGSRNSEDFYNGLSIGLYTAGYVCFQMGKQLRLNDMDDPVILGKAYYPQNILISNESHAEAIFDELLGLEPVKRLLAFFDDPPERIFAYEKDAITRNLSSLFGFCQEILEWAMVYEISELTSIKRGDFILRDGTLRSLQIRQKHLTKLGKHIHDQGLTILAITKKSPIKMELAYTFKQMDNYLQDSLKRTYPFVADDPKRQKLCCWFEVPETVLLAAYGQGNMYAKQGLKGGRGFGCYFVARLDYVEKLQNYDWVVVDLNIFDVMPGIAEGDMTVDTAKLRETFFELTRLTQEHYILGYPYPLVEAHNFVSLSKDFKEEVVNRVRYSLYKDQRLDNVDIENLFLDTHDRF
jgi:hypothetical protein